MHYANGQEAKAGDLIIVQEDNGSDNWTQTIGVLVSGIAGATACNANAQVSLQRKKSPLGWGPWYPITGVYCCTLSNCNPVAFDSGPAPTGGGPGDPHP